jgi:hypothetical protein
MEESMARRWRFIHNSSLQGFDPKPSIVLLTTISIPTCIVRPKSTEELPFASFNNDFGEKRAGFSVVFELTRTQYDQIHAIIYTYREQFDGSVVVPNDRWAAADSVAVTVGMQTFLKSKASGISGRQINLHACMRGMLVTCVLYDMGMKKSMRLFNRGHMRLSGPMPSFPQTC